LDIHNNIKSAAFAALLKTGTPDSASRLAMQGVTNHFVAKADLNAYL